MQDYVDGYMDFLANNFFGQVVLMVLSVSTLISVIEWVGLMPECVLRKLRRNRTSDVVLVLKDLGVDFHEEKRSRSYKKVSSFLRGEKRFKERVEESLRDATKKGDFRVGQRNEVYVSEFIDVMSSVCSERKAVIFARYLSTFFYKILCVDNGFGGKDFDFVVTPKCGSPVLGYEFSKILEKPLVLHNHREQKYRLPDDIVIGAFDSDFQLKAGMKGIIVDDSTTGGGKVIDAINDLRRIGCKVDDCLVLFEPKVKKVSDVLKDYNVNLHSIVKV